MKSKRLLKFYYSADSLNRALDNLITGSALASADCGKSGDFYAEKIIEIIAAKKKLDELWRYLDGVMGGFSEEEGKVLRYYAQMRGGTARLPEGVARGIKRVTVKFARRARNAERFDEGIRLVGEYYSLM